MNEENTHAHGLARDLAAIERQLLGRRKMLRMLASTGMIALLPGCGGGSRTVGSSAAAASAEPLAAASTPTGSGSAATTSGSAESCIADPAETAGPFPGDGTNTAGGSTSNVLTSSGIARSDIRSSFLATRTTAAGVKVDLTIKLVNVNSACAPLAGYAIYLWHCDANGNYSLYSAPSESYLRGVQVTDAKGEVTFTTIFPACYSGRFPHIHFEIYRNPSAATSGRNALLTSQFAMPAAQCNAVFADASIYPGSASRFAQVPLSSDNVFADNTAAQIAQQTPAFSGTPVTGYTAAAVVGIAA